MFSLSGEVEAGILSLNKSGGQKIMFFDKVKIFQLFYEVCMLYFFIKK